MRKHNLLNNTLKFIVLSIFFVLIVYPIYTVIVSSLKSNDQIYTNVFSLPTDYVFSNYQLAWTKGSMSTYLFNSVINTGVSTIGVVLFASMIAFVLTRRDFVGKKVVYVLFVMGIAIPAQVAIVQEYLLLSNLKLLNSNLGLILIYIAYGLPFAVFIMYNFFRSISKEIQEAAVVDGCSSLKLYWKIIMPLSPPVLTSVAIFNLVWVWNDMFFPLIMTSKKAYKTLPLGLMALKGEFFTDYGMLFAGVVLVSLPLTLAYLLMQKQFAEGMTAGAVKE